jgi:hypothetical protein
MPADKYIALDTASGRFTRVTATVVSSGAANAGEIPALDDDGLLDPSVIPNTTGLLTIRRVLGWYLDGLISVGQDLGPNYTIDADVDVLGIAIFAKSGPTTVAAQFDVLYSTDDGSSFTSLFSTLPTIPTGSHIGGAAAVLSHATLDAGDILRFDVIAVGTTPVQGVTVELQIRFR